MLRKLSLAALIAVVGGVSLSTDQVCGQDPVLDELYGRGVHRFFAHDYVQAFDHFSLAINNGSQDPRVYYFRGLALMATGRMDEGQSDWQTGAQIEARGTYDGAIGRSLARIQGPSRVALEHIRQMARVEARTEAKMRDDERYGKPGAAPVPVQPIAPATQPAPDSVPADNPFADDAPAAQGAPQVDSNDAFGGTLDSITPEPVTPADSGTTPGPASDAPAGGDVFGGDAPAGGDVFGGDAPGPGGDAPADDDPFGGF